MGDFFQIVIIVGIVVIALIKQLRKAAEKADREREQQTYTPETEAEGNNTPPFLSYDFEPLVPPAPTPPRKKESAHPPRKNNEAKKMQAPLLHEEQEDEQPNFNIHSTEEARRAIVWSEILNRKY